MNEERFWLRKKFKSRVLTKTLVADKFAAADGVGPGQSVQPVGH